MKCGDGIKVDPAKVDAIKIWKAPRDKRGIRSFIGFANFYRNFIPDFAHISDTLMKLTRKGGLFRWDSEQQKAFDLLKIRFTEALVLAMWREDRLTVLETDASGWATGGYLSQYNTSGSLRPIAYYSKKLAPAECNYDIHDKELLAIIRCLNEWRGELMGLQQVFIILTDHKNLQYFMTSRKLTERQVRWSQTPSQFNFRIQYRSGKQAGRPDAFSRRTQDMPTNIDYPRLREREFQLIKESWPFSNPDVKATELSTLAQQSNKFLWASIYLKIKSYKYFGIKV